MKLQINKKTFELSFGFGVFFILGKHWKFDNFQDTLNKVAVIDQVGDNLKFEALEVLADVVKACIVANKENAVAMDGLDSVGIIEFMVANPLLIGEMVQNIVAAMPKQQEPEKTVGK